MATEAASSSFLVIILDVSPLAWGERDLMRSSQDKARQAAGKRTVGPVILREVLESAIAFASAACSIERNCRISIFAVADNESAMVFPRKNAVESPDMSRIPEDVLSGVAELLQKAATKAAINDDPANRLAGMAGATSRALCYINRFLISSSNTGISALHSTVSAAVDPGESGDPSPIVALAEKSSKPKQPNGSVAPRILLIQASDDRSRDYNAMMNCAFAASKQNIVLDGCYLGMSSNQSSSFLEQACDLTDGVFLSPKGATQVGGALTEVLISGFLPTMDARNFLNVPAIHKVDFRARCFETQETVDMAFVCNQCLSIYKNTPTASTCPTCGANIVKT